MVIFDWLLLHFMFGDQPDVAYLTLLLSPVWGELKWRAEKKELPVFCMLWIYQ